MVKTISQAELAKLMSEGAEVEREPHKITIEGLSEMMADLRIEMSKLAKERAEMDARIMRQMTSVVEKLTAAIDNNKAEQIDLRPVLKELVLLQKARSFNNKQQPKPDYVFDVKRNQRGYITSVRATPIEQTKH